MAYKFRKWRIRWQKPTKRFKKIRRDRKKSREAHRRFLRNRGKMKQGLRITRRKGRLQMKKNKAAGIYKKMSSARKRWKNILKSDNSLEMFINMRLDEELGEPELEIIADRDVEGIIQILQDMKDNIDIEDKEEEKETIEYIDDAIEALEDMKGIEELEPEDEDFLEDIISFIEEYGEEAGYISPDDENTPEEVEEE